MRQPSNLSANQLNPRKLRESHSAGGKPSLPRGTSRGRTGSISSQFDRALSSKIDRLVAEFSTTTFCCRDAALTRSMTYTQNCAEIRPLLFKLSLNQR